MDKVYEIVGDYLLDGSFFVHLDSDSEAYARCGVSFNPSNDERVDRIKLLSALLMQEINDSVDFTDSFKHHAAESAKDHVELAQMLAVKMLFVKQSEAERKRATQLFTAQASVETLKYITNAQDVDIAA